MNANARSLTVALVAMAAVSAIACGSRASSSSPSPRPTASTAAAVAIVAPSLAATVATVAPTPVALAFDHSTGTFAPPKPASLTVAGQAVARVTVNTVGIASTFDASAPASDGRLYLFARVTVSALVDGVPFDGADWTLTNDGAAIPQTAVPQLEPLGRGVLTAGQEAHGFVAFLVAPAGLALLSYTPAGAPVVSIRIRCQAGVPCECGPKVPGCPAHFAGLY
jgi:hypothetical protein